MAADHRFFSLRNKKKTGLCYDKYNEYKKDNYIIQSDQYVGKIQNRLKTIKIIK